MTKFSTVTYFRDGRVSEISQYHPTSRS